MKKIILLVAILSVSLINAQAFIGSGDNKFQVGANFQDNATGLNLSYDFGVGENMSFGVSSTYALGVNENIDASFGDRFDVKARFNANLGNVVSSDENFDIYPGLNFSLKNFGGHLGARYFFSDGFGVYSEINVPLAKYNTDILTPAEKLHNQFTVSFGAAFNL
jgi:outer membrane protein G